MNTLQTKLTRLNAQLKITKGNRAKAKIIIEILKVESAIEQLELKQKEITLTWEQKKSLNALTGGNLPVFSKLTENSKEELLKISNELEALSREEYQDNCTGKGAWKKPSKASIQRSEKRSQKYRLLRERVEQLELIQEKPVEVKKEIEVKNITVKIPVSVSTLKKHCDVPSAEMTDQQIINGWKYSLAAQSMQRDFRTQENIQWEDRHLLLNIVYWVDQYQQEMDKRGLTEKYCLWIEKKQAFKDEFYKKPVDAPVTKKDEFCKKPEKTTIKFLEAKFKDAQIEITDKQIVLKSETSELAINLSFEIPDISDYYNQSRRTKTIRNLKQNQTSKIHSVCEYISSILLAA